MPRKKKVNDIGPEPAEVHGDADGMTVSKYKLDLPPDVLAKATAWVLSRISVTFRKLTEAERAAMMDRRCSAEGYVTIMRRHIDHVITLEAIVHELNESGELESNVGFGMEAFDPFTGKTGNVLFSGNIDSVDSMVKSLPDSAEQAAEMLQAARNESVNWTLEQLAGAGHRNGKEIAAALAEEIRKRFGGEGKDNA